MLQNDDIKLLTQQELKILKNQEAESLRVFWICFLPIVFGAYFAWSTPSDNLFHWRSMTIIGFCVLAGCIGLYFTFEQYKKYQIDVQKGLKASLNGTLAEKIAKQVNSKVNYFVVIDNQKFAIPNDAVFDYDPPFSLATLREGEKVRIWFAPQSKFVLDIESLDNPFNFDAEENDGLD
jgi:hypothetical protein